MTVGPLTELEICTGMLFGGGGPVDLRDGSGTVREVLDEQLRGALVTGRCVVAFSGGRDSSVLLAAATRLARAEGHALPVPLTYRYAAHPRTNEDEWQEAVIAHLGLTDWQRMSISDDFDALGPIARGVLEGFGLMWPANGHTMVPLLESARGGALITGNGGDEVFSWRPRSWRGNIRHLVRARDRRAVHAAVVALLPRASRRALLRRVPPLRLSWLTGQGSRELNRSLADAWSVQARDWEDQVSSWLSRRYIGVARSAFDFMARQAGAELVEPFWSRAFAAALVRTAPAQGWGNRTAALNVLFPDLLPARVLSRSSKAVFTEVIWGPEARAFAQCWDGTGLDKALIDPEALRRVWLRERPDMRSVTALQAAWLRGRGAPA